MTVREFINRFNKGEFDSADVDTQIDAGWYDWFCRDTSLAAKTKILATKISQIMDSKLFDPDKTTVYFNNNCPCFGNLYDSFGIKDIKTGELIVHVSPKFGHDGKYKNKTEIVIGEKEYYFDNWKKAKDFINACTSTSVPFVNDY